MNESRRKKNVLSLFSGCGGMDLGFEGDFEVLEASINKKIHPTWFTARTQDGWTRVPKTVFDVVFANDIKPEAKKAWMNYFSKKKL